MKPRGPIQIAWKHDGSFKLSLRLPEDMQAQVDLPITGKATSVFCEGKRVEATRVSNRWKVDQPVSGNVTFEVK